jgi:hypothetical protein
MAEHHVAVQVNAPVHQVYNMFTHFHDFPKFMHFVKEVTYYDDQRSHWVAQIAGKHEWDAVNEDWIPDRQIGWRSINGFENRGKVTFREVGNAQSLVDVFLYYNPPLGKIGEFAENMSINTRFDEALQHDLENFARMVEQAPANTDDPMASRYLFHSGSAVGTDTATNRQKESMAHDTMMSPQALQEREQAIKQELSSREATRQEEKKQREQAVARQQQVAQEMRETLAHQQELDKQIRSTQEAANAQPETPQQVGPQATIGGRGASIPNTALGDLDAHSARYPGYEQDEMKARRIVPLEQEEAEIVNPEVQQTEHESPWNASNQSPEE